MNDQIERALATLADRGNDPGAAQVWARANADAPRRRRRTQVRAGAAGVAAVLVASFLVFALSANAICVPSGDHAGGKIVVASNDFTRVPSGLMIVSCPE